MHNHSKPALQLIDVYPLMCWLLHLPRPWLHWGHLARVTRLLSQPPLHVQVEEFENRARAWRTLALGLDSKFGVSRQTFLAGKFLRRALIRLS